MNTNMSIVVVGCDKYSDIAEYYLEFLHKNWNDCMYPVFVATESYQFNDPNVRSIICGKDSTWTGRAIEAISKTETDYILLTVDDIYMSEKVDSEEISKILDFMESEKILYYRIPVFRTTKKYDVSYPGNENVELIRAQKPYAVSIGTAIWNKEEILKILGDGTKTAWDLENDFSQLSMNTNTTFIEKYVSDKRFLLHSVHMIKAGRWIPKAAKEMTKKGNSIDYSERGFVPFSQTMRSHIYGIGSKLCPPSMRKTVKKIMTKVGFTFATNN